MAFKVTHRGLHNRTHRSDLYISGRLPTCCFMGRCKITETFNAPLRFYSRIRENIRTMTGSGFKVCNTVKLCESVSVSTLFEQAKNLSQDWVWMLPGLLFISGCHCTDFFTEMIGVKIGHTLSHITVSQLATVHARQCMRVCISTSPWLHSYCQEVQGCSSFF